MKFRRGARLAGERGSSLRFLYVHTGVFEPTVLESQVADSLVAVRAHGIQFDTAVLLHGNSYVRRWSYNQQRRRELSQRIGGKVSLYFAPREGFRIGDLIGTAALYCDLIRGGARRTVIHARGDSAAFFAHQVQQLGMNVRYVYDARGDSEAEFGYEKASAQLDQRTRSLLLDGIERHRRAAVRGASHVWCVSSVLRNRLQERYGCPSDRMSVIPCVADDTKFHLDEADRHAMRQCLGIDDRFVVVYPGRLGLWHYSQEMLGVVGGLMQAFDDVFFLMLTPDVEVGAQLARKSLPEGRYQIHHARHDEVPRYLRAADLGLLLRERHPLNEVACPTKFGEYILSGLPVLISSGIGDCSRFVCEQRAGAVLEQPDPAQAANEVARLRSEDAATRRVRINSHGRAFSRLRAAGEMASVYRRLAEV